jgi:hypothetical protein
LVKTAEMCQDPSGSPKKTMVSAPAKPANVATPGSIDRKGIKILKARGPKFTVFYVIWLVVWNIFYFSTIYGIILPN